MMMSPGPLIPELVVVGVQLLSSIAAGLRLVDAVAVVVVAAAAGRFLLLPITIPMMMFLLSIQTW